MHIQTKEGSVHKVKIPIATFEAMVGMVFFRGQDIGFISDNGIPIFMSEIDLQETYKIFREKHRCIIKGGS